MQIVRNSRIPFVIINSSRTTVRPSDVQMTYDAGGAWGQLLPFSKLRNLSNLHLNSDDKYMGMGMGMLEIVNPDARRIYNVC